MLDREEASGVTDAKFSNAARTRNPTSPRSRHMVSTNRGLRAVTNILIVSGKNPWLLLLFARLETLFTETFTSATGALSSLFAAYRHSV